MKMLSLAATAALLMVTPAMADFDLTITEIYFGQNDPNVTEDWFEITNFGDMAWDGSSDAGLYTDDFEPDPVKAGLIPNLDPIGPGDSAIVVIFDIADYQNPEGEPQLTVEEVAQTVIDDYTTAWSNLPGLNVAAVDGSGYSSSNVDGPTIWLGDPNVDGILLDTATYPDPESINGLPDGASYDVALRSFSSVGNRSGAVLSVGLGGGDGVIPAFQPAIGSPGSSAVPEPATIVIAIIAAIGVIGRRRV